MRNRYGVPAPQQENEFHRSYHHGAYLGASLPARHRGGSEPSYYQWSSDPGTRSHRAYDSRKSG